MFNAYQTKFKAYQIKWFFILPGILTITTLLLRQHSFKDVKWKDFTEYAFHLSSLFFACWLIHGYFLLHKFKRIGNYTKLVISNVMAISVTYLLSYLYFIYLPKTNLIDNATPFSTIPEIITHITGSFFVSIISYVVFYSIHTNSALQNAKLENESLEQAHLRAQLLSLQQQISPHFLFNSLSTLKTIANDQPTKNYIVQLATVYRYLLNFNDRYLTTLKDELTFIRSYLYIMNERFEDALKVNIDIPDDYLILQIPPLSLQLLVENAIKHNTISSDKPLCISILTDTTPALIVKNNLQPKNVPEEGTGTGLNNIKERYKLLIHKSIRIVNDQSTFSVTLPLLKK